MHAHVQTHMATHLTRLHSSLGDESYLSRKSY